MCMYKHACVCLSCHLLHACAQRSDWPAIARVAVQRAEAKLQAPAPTDAEAAGDGTLADPLLASHAIIITTKHDTDATHVTALLADAVDVDGPLDAALASVLTHDAAYVDPMHPIAVPGHASHPAAI